MTRGAFFLMCLQTLVLKSSLTGVSAVEVLRCGAELPEEAFGTDDPATCAVQFFAWKVGPKKPVPEWLAAYEEAKSNALRVRRSSVAAVLWWSLAEQAFADALEGAGPPCPREMAHLLDGSMPAMVVTKETGEAFRTWVECIPGHEEGPFAFEPAKL